MQKYKIEPGYDEVSSAITSAFKKRMGYEPNLENPATFSEKMQFLKLHFRDPGMPKLADKLLVRDELKKLGLADLLTQLIATYDKASEIDFDQLPQSFVIKTNHDSGGVVVVRDKDAVDQTEVKKKIKKRLRAPYINGIRHGEWHYLYIKRKIIVEEYLADSNDELPDYKVHCFHGQPKYIHVDFDRGRNHTRQFYDIDWTPMGFTSKYKLADRVQAKPANLTDMLQIAEKISQALPYSRIDFYSVEDRLYFGEVTFYHHNGMGEFIPVEWDQRLGDLLNVKQLNNSC